MGEKLSSSEMNILRGMNNTSHKQQMHYLVVQKLSSQATLPTRGSTGAAGYDLASAIDTVVPARGKVQVPTDLCFLFPEGTYGRIAPRSGLAWRHHIDVGAGVIDHDFRGNVTVILFNHGDVDMGIQRGDRIAQLILEQHLVARVVEVDKLPNTMRGDQGFGSTGISSTINE
jgi:dUTP pyrophosphatase